MCLIDEDVFQGKKGVWIKLPIELVNLVEPAVKVRSLPIISLLVLALDKSVICLTLNV